MTVREILKMGDPRLLRMAEPVREFGTAELDALIVDMFDTMHAANGAGLAAPQIGVPLRVVLFGITANPRYPEAPPIPETLLINPRLTPLGEEHQTGWEGCLSVPGLRGEVRRWRRLQCEAVDSDGRPLRRTVEGFEARVIQHECDHLDGVLFPDRLVSPERFGFSEELRAAGLIA